MICCFASILRAGSGALLPLFLSLVPGIAECAVIYVPDDHPDIQAAVQASSDWDTIIVRPGTYVENIDFLGRKITVKSEHGPELTIIDGNQAGSVVTFVNHETVDSVLEGFCIRNGSGTSYLGEMLGGGIFCVSSHPTLTNNRVTGNSTDQHGGGICCINFSHPSITYNTIFGNSAGEEGGGIACDNHSHALIAYNTISGNSAGRRGGGVSCTSKSSPEILANTIEENTASNIYWHDGGGAVNCYLWSSPDITSNIIRNNSSTSCGGAVVCCEHSSPELHNNIISGNSAYHSGGGLFLDGGSAPQLINNVISGNRAEYQNGGGVCCMDGSSPPLINNIITNNSAGLFGSGSGGGVFCDESSPVITNCTFSLNWGNSFGGGICCTNESFPTVINSILSGDDAPCGQEIHVGSSSYPSALTISYSDVRGGQASASVETGCTIDWGQGIIDSDPLFVDPAGRDFHIFYTSPCRNAGDNTAPGLFPEDFEGDPRAAHGFVDMGADEFHRHLYCIGDLVPGGAVEVKIVGDPGTGPIGLWYGPNALENPVHGAYGDWYMLPPMIFMGPLPLIPAQGVKVLGGDIPASPPGPYSIHMQALIGDELSNLCTLEVEEGG